MIENRVVYFFYYKPYLKLYNHAVCCIAALYVFLHYKQIAKDIV